MANFLHEYTNKFGGLFSIKKQTSNVLGGTIYFAARGDVTQFRHREVRLEG
jgi:hypothetical protein